MLATVLACGSATAQVRVKGSVFGGGNNADVQTNTVVNISAGQVEGNVYGGGNVGDVGTINKTNIRAYKWTDEANPGDTYSYNNTGSCTVTITGGTIGPDGETTPDDKGNVYGAGKGVAESFWCEKAMVYKTTVTISGGTVKNTVFGGGEVGRVENNTVVTIGVEGATDGAAAPTIAGDVFGAGMGLATHGYSALVRGNTNVTIQGTARVGRSVYGGGEIATVGKYNLVQETDVDTDEHRAAFLADHPGVDPLIEVGMPYSIVSDNLGICTVSVKDNAVIGQSGSGDVFGAGKGVEPAYTADDAATTDTDERSKRMMSYNSTLYTTANQTTWAYSDDSHEYVWEYFDTEAKYLTFVQTLALATQTYVTVGGSAQVNGSVYGGSESGYVQHHTQVTVQETCNVGNSSLRGNVFGGGRGISGNTTAGRASGNTTVNILGGTTYGDVYGGGEKGPVGTSSTTTTDSETSTTTTTYPTATVNLLGGTITGDAYGGGLGDPSTAADAGNTQVNLNGMATSEYTAAFADYLVALNTSPSDDDTTDDYYMVKTDRAGCKVNRIFGANNTNGTPKGNVTVHVYATQSKAEGKTTIGAKSEKDTNTYDLSAVYGGGNEAAYDPVTPYENGTGSKSQVIIEGCAYTSIETVYGGGNAAAVPETNVFIRSDREIGTVFGGGNGRDAKANGDPNPGADIGTKDQGANRYGTGNANTLITGGYVHEAYGGSNEKGTIMGSVNLDASADGICEMLVKKMVGAGKNADIMGNAIVTLGCMPETWVDEYYGGADNANVHGNVELTITSGNFRKVFGANNAGGIIMGHVKVNIEETGCRPINIDELYLGGNQAAYSRYGYYVVKDEDDAPILNGGKLTFKPRESANDTHPAVKPSFAGSTYQEYAGTEDDTFTPYAQPELNIISCTRIGKVFGGGLGETAKMYADPTVNINQIYGTPGGVKSNALGAIGGSYTLNGTPVDGGVFGGGNQATVYGNTTVNIGNLTEVSPVTTPTGLDKNANDKYDVVGANIVGNVYGGGNEADVTGNTFVHVCANKGDETDSEYQAVSDGSVGVHITGNVYGGGKGVADNFLCNKAMIGTNDAGLDENYTDGNTSVVIGNGTIDGTVYGGGQIGRVERNTTVTIGLGEGTATGTATSAPEINGNVFGAGAGEEEHGYAALVRGNPTVTIQGNAKIGKSVYGGGEIASVARYKVAQDEEEAAAHEVEVDMPYVLENNAYGHCVVTIGGYAEIGPDNMKMYHEDMTEGTDKPDDFGHVFGAGRGVLPKVYTSYGEDNNGPRRRVLAADKTTSIWEYFADETKYFEFIRTLALATETEVTIGDHAFIKGSVYGGSENGIVQFNTYVTIQDHCQIGQGKEITTRYEDYTDGNLFELNAPPVKSGSGSEAVYYDLECASWEYDSSSGAPYDPNAKYLYNGKYYYDVKHENDAAGGSIVGKDGHTYYGNVFGGGSGSVPYFDTNQGRSRYVMSAGWVKGNTNVTINGGHILTNVYGGNEATNVDGTATVTMNGGTVGVPRTLAQIDAHPVTCYLFGAGKGDQRVFFNKDTNVKDVVVNITGGRIFGSVFGGGEDGHVLRDVTMTIGKQTTTGEGAQATTTTSGPTIGTWGTSYVDGNVFGGGRGFGGDAYTAGNVAGSVTMNINGGIMLGSIYGGGRLGSVGYGLFDETTNGQPTPGYGKMRADDAWEEGFSTTGYFTKGRGHIDITISGGTIGNDYEYIVPNSSNIPNTITQTDISKWTPENWTAWKAHNHIPKTEFDASGRLTHTKGGNVFAGGMGRQTQLDGQTPISAIKWWQLGCVKQTKLTITGGHIKSNVYGGGELGAVIPYTNGSTTEGGTTEIDISGSAVIGTVVSESVTTGTGESAQTSNEPLYTFGSVFGGGMGSESDTSTEEKIGGRVAGSTKITMSAGAVKGSVYGGGELAIVQGSHTTESKTVGAEINISGGTIGYNQDGFGGATMGNVYGGGKGSLTTANAGLIKNNTLVKITGTPTIYHNIYGGGAYGSVGTFDFTTSIPENWTDDTGKAEVIVEGGTIGINGHENGMVFGSSRGDVAAPTGSSAVDPNDRLAWVYDTHVVIGNSSGGPSIKGTVYGSGENGHTFNNTLVDVNKGTIGIETGEDITYTENGKPFTKGGAAYPYRGNVYGGGCGTDMYDSNGDGTDDTFNPLAGIVLGNATVNITGGTVVRNVYGAGAMGSVGKTVTTTNESSTTTTITGGTTTIKISGGTIGVDGTNGDGNVFGAARGDADAKINEFALVKKETGVSVTGGTINGNVYGGGELGCVGTFTISNDMRTFTWTDTDGTDNAANNEKNTGVCNVTVDGSSAVINGHVYGAGKGKEDTFWCEKGIAYSTNVNIKNGTVGHNVYGGGEVGRVETDTQVKIGNGTGTAEGTFAPTITGNVFGGGAGVETHGYSALVRGNTTVTVEGNADVRKSIYGGGMIASVGRYGLDENDMPSILQGGGYCYVTVQGSAQIGEDVFGAGKGVTPAYTYVVSDDYDVRMNNSKRMVPYSPYNETTKKGQKEDDWKKTWDYVEVYPADYSGIKFVWEYFDNKLPKYSTYLETLALATHPEVTIDGNATVRGSVFGGGELGLTKGSVIVTIKGGTIEEDVYGGGSLANTNTTSTVDLDGNGTTENIDPTTKVILKGGTINRNVYGGGLGRLAKDAVEAQAAHGTEGAPDYVPAVEAQPAVEPIAAKVYGNVLVELNKTTDTDNCVVKGNIFGCNNLNGSPQASVTVHVYKTADYAGHEKDASKSNSKFNVNAVYGGGNLAAFYPDDATTRATAKANVIIDGCDLTSIGTVYGGGNAASVPETDVVINSAYEIGQAFGGGNGADEYAIDGKTYENPGANVGYMNYAYHTWDGIANKYIAHEYTTTDGTDKDASTKELRVNNYGTGYGTGNAHISVLGGTVHAVYAGSNTRGNIRVESRATLKDADDNDCPFVVTESYGGGKNALQDGNAVLDIDCISGMGKAYGGASNADVNGDVKLTITNGTYGQVFGGNDAGGCIRGSITVNIEETGCRPIIIGELYGGGNEAAYSIYGYNGDGSLKTSGTAVASPTVNVRSFTSIGKIFGGGYGEAAKMVGDPVVNVNVLNGKYAATAVVEDGSRVIGSSVKEPGDTGYDATKGFPIPSHTADAIGAIQDVFGGGNAAEVVGTPHVMIGTEEYVPIVSIATGDAVTGYYTRSGSEGNYTYTEITDIDAKAVSDTTYYKKVLGVDIRGNVYGGGNNAEVTGHTNVVIGKKAK